jgi:YebC/PmpR family DNA-binding regulatory protein
MPMDNIERAIKKGTGEGEANPYIEVAFEGYGPGGTALLVQALTDNRNRTLQEMRNLFNRGGGSLGEAGCVAWIFQSRGLITIETGEMDGEEVALQAIDAGAEDVKIEEGSLEVYTDLEKLEAVRQALEEQNIPIASAEMSMIPTTTVDLKEKEAVQALKLIEKIEDHDDVQQVYSNVDFSEEVLEKLRAQD